MLAACMGVSLVSSGTQHESTDVGSREARPAGLWRYYMHGITDDFATHIDVMPLIDLPMAAPAALVDVEIDTPYVREHTTAVRLEAGQRIAPAGALPVPLEVVRGRTVRLFTWVRGQDVGRTGSTNSYGDAPHVSLVARDASGRQLSRSSQMDGVATTGTFPWHCYHIEMFVPQTASGLFLELENPAGGRVWFARLGWEVAEGPRAFSLNDRQDPDTGSVASNVTYDTLNRQFHRGVPTAYKWNFLRGPGAGLVGQQYDIGTRDGLRAYFAEQVLTDADHINHSLMYFASRYHAGRALDLLPQGVDETWLAELRDLVVGAQDPETGYWGTRSRQASMGMTFHVIEGLFAYYGPRRTDRAEVVNDRRHLGVGRIPLADRIVRTTLAMQASRLDDPGELAAWPRHAYDFTAAPDAFVSRASLVVTGNAIELLRRSERFVDTALQKRIYRAIRAAVRYVLETCVEDDGVWRQSDVTANPSSGAYMERILGMSHYLERRIDTSVTVPDVSATLTGGGRLRVSWRKPDASHVALRVYSIDESQSPDQGDERDIVGILHRSGARPVEMDPLTAARAMGRAATARWGRGWNRASYVGEKVGSLRPDLQVAGEMSSLDLEVEPGHRLHASAVTWYGEESPAVVLDGPHHLESAEE